MNITQILIDYFTFNRKEQRGILVLVTILFTMVVANAIIPSVIPGKPPDFSRFENEIADFERDMKREDSLENYRDKQKHYFRPGTGFMNNDSGGIRNLKPKELIIIELNGADTFELQRLRGIGSSFAKRIVRYRERLGGFTEKSQLIEVFGMDTARYNGVKANLTVNKDSIHKININNVTFKDLMKHPYFPFSITKAIILYRKDHKVFKSIEELKSIKGVNDSIFAKMKVYIKIE